MRIETTDGRIIQLDLDTVSKIPLLTNMREHGGKDEYDDEIATIRLPMDRATFTKVMRMIDAPDKAVALGDLYGDQDKFDALVNACSFLLLENIVDSACDIILEDLDGMPNG